MNRSKGRNRNGMGKSKKIRNGNGCGRIIVEIGIRMKK
jgi:hypothetical protein